MSGTKKAAENGHAEGSVLSLVLCTIMDKGVSEIKKDFSLV